MNLKCHKDKLSPKPSDSIYYRSVISTFRLHTFPKWSVSFKCFDGIAKCIPIFPRVLLCIPVALAAEVCTSYERCA